MERERAAQTAFSGVWLDRRPDLRSDANGIVALKQAPEARVCVFTQGEIIFMSSEQGVRFMFSLAEANAFGSVADWVFLGMDATGPLFACALEKGRDETTLSQADLTRIYRANPAAQLDGFHHMDLRSFILRGYARDAQSGVLAQAKSLLNWHESHGFCCNCGAPTQSVEAGWRRDCAACDAHHFPRTDPVVIMLPYHGDFCVLGRQPRFPLGLYAPLAGYIEGGETLEDAVRREIHEEVGLRTGAVRYLASQPWPFPHSFMLGCFAETRKRDLVIDTTELADARWFSRQETRALLNGAMEELFCPPPMAIAYHLITTWVNGEA